MIDFSTFLIICQRQIQPLLKISSPEGLENFNKKLKQIILSLGQICPQEWLAWKQAQGISETWGIVKKEAEVFLSLIEGFEFKSNGQEIVIYLDKESKSFPLIDPVHFIKSNLYEREDIYFYLLLGEMLLEENLSILQIYSVQARVRDLKPN